ncbi:MAG: SdrD B-like domain-containing protein [Candidatus Nitrosocaldaceae archaeon]
MKYGGIVLIIMLLTANAIISIEATGNISGYVFIDNNLNGIKDAAEVGKSNFSITLTGTAINGSSITLTTTSNRNGYYSFSVPDGSYQVTLSSVQNWGNTTPKSVNVVISSSSSSVNFGIVKLGQISARTFNDNNKNGIKDSNESYRSWSFRLTGTLNNGTVINNTLTGNPAKFVNLYPGTYNVKALDSSGFIFTTPNNVNITLNGANYQPSFGVVKAAIIQGYVYNDTNSNGAKNSNEPPLSNWQVFLYKNDVLIASKYSDSNGFFSFTVESGIYKLTTEARDHAFTQPSSGEYTINATTTTITKYFGLTKNYDILAGLGDIVAFHAFNIEKDSMNRLILNVGNSIKRFDINGILLNTLNIGNPENKEIGGLAIDHNDNIIFTIDNKVVKISSTGMLIFSKQLNVTGNYIRLSGVAVDSNNTIYVVSKFDHKIFVLSKDGILVKTIGSAGFSEGYLRLPFDLTIDSQNRIIVANTGNNRIDIFDTNGNFIKSFGGFGSANGKFNKPRGVIVDDYDNIYVADTYNHRIQVFDTNGNFIRNFGSLGSDPGEFGNPSGLYVDNDIYVYDLSNDRVSIHDINGNYIREFNFTDPYIEPYFVYVNNDKAYISDGHRHKVIIVNATNGAFIDEFGGLGSLNGEFRGPRGIALSNSEIYVADNYNARIQVFDTNGNFIRNFGSYGSGSNNFNQPRGLVLFNNNLYIADTQNDRIKITDINGNLIKSISSIKPYQIAVDNNGYIYAAEFSLDRIRKYDSNGNVMMSINNINATKGVYVDSYYNIYAGVSDEHKIKKYDSNGNLLLTFGTFGLDPGEFFNTRGIFVDNIGRIWVADGDAHRVQVFDGNGSLLMIIDYNTLFN